MAHICSHKTHWMLHNPLRKYFNPPELPIQLLDIQPEYSVLEIGCGSGFFTLPIAKHLDGKGRLFACDVQPEMIEHCKRRFKRKGVSINHIEWAVLDIGNDDIKTTDEFEACLLPFVLHEVTDSQQAAALNKIYDKLKKGGKLYFVEPRSAVSGNKWGRAVQLLLQTGFKIVSESKTMISKTMVLKK